MKGVRANVTAGAERPGEISNGPTLPVEAYLRKLPAPMHLTPGGGPKPWRKMPRPFDSIGSEDLGSSERSLHSTLCVLPPSSD